MSFRQPRYIAPADPNVVSKAIMKATSEGFDKYNERLNAEKKEDKEDKDSKPSGNTTTNIYNNYYREK
tara:strand:+ start:5053 stop:5256 length:204 start_codon:yes stop_codon:yes gene_type:complete